MAWVAALHQQQALRGDVVTMRAMKNKTLAVWITFLAGPVGLHRLYLLGRYDVIGWLLPFPTVLGVYGVLRVRALGVDDALSWLLIPILGVTLAGCALTAIVYGLTDAEKWNKRFNPQAAADAPAGQTGWLTIAGVVSALFLGATVLMATIAFGVERFFTYTT